ncbi:MAG: hypothetical protein QXS93_04295 [Candidatus Micrarchaeia archaeon]
MSKTLKIIGATSLAVVAFATSAVTYNSHSHVSPAIEQRAPAAKLSDELQKARKKVSIPEDQCKSITKNAVEKFNNLKIPPDVVYSSRVWFYSYSNDQRCGFFYPKGQGYTVVSSRDGCERELLHADAHKLYNSISRFIENDPIARKKFSEMLFNIIGKNPDVAGKIYFANFSYNGNVPSIGPAWGGWLTGRARKAEEIYKGLEYLFAAGAKSARAPASTATGAPNDAGAGNTVADRALYNAQQSIIGTGFVGTGTGTDISDLQRDYFGKFLRALEASAQAVSDQRTYKELMREIGKLKEIYEWAKTNYSVKKNEKPAALAKKPPVAVEKQFKEMRNSMQNALDLLRKSSPAAAAYLGEWLASQVMPVLMEEMFARLNEDLALKRNSAIMGGSIRGQPMKRKDANVGGNAKGDVSKRKDAMVNEKAIVDKESLSTLLEIASIILNKVEAGEYKDKEGALKVATHIRRLVNHYLNDKAQPEDTKQAAGIGWQDVLKEPRCFKNAESAIIAAELDEVERLHRRNMDILAQLPEERVFYLSYLFSLFMLAGAGYLAYTGTRKED